MGGMNDKHQADVISTRGISAVALSVVADTGHRPILPVAGCALHLRLPHRGLAPT